MTTLSSDLYKFEGGSALFKGLGPTLVGVIPARSINFFTYGNGKLFIADKFNGGVENSAVHLSAAVVAGAPYVHFYVEHLILIPSSQGSSRPL